METEDDDMNAGSRIDPRLPCVAIFEQVQVRLAPWGRIIEMSYDCVSPRHVVSLQQVHWNKKHIYT